MVTALTYNIIFLFFKSAIYATILAVSGITIYLTILQKHIVLTEKQWNKNIQQNK